MRRAVIPGAIAALIVPRFQVLVAPAAFAAGCPTFTGDDFIASRWTSNTVRGAEAPVQLRTTGTVCSNDREDSDWVAIEESGGQFQIVQAGFLRKYNSTTNTTQSCRVWAIGQGTPHAYDCGVDTTGTYVYFRVVVFWDPTAHLYYYSVQDCGTGGYSSCTDKNDQQQFFSDGEGAVAAAEANFGPTCFDRIMGSSLSPANVGTNVNQIKWQNSVGGAWSTHTLTKVASPCTHYHGAYTNSIISAWDDRN